MLSIHFMVGEPKDMKNLRFFGVFGLISLLLAARAPAQPAATGRMPDQNAQSVCVDTHLALAFDAAPAVGTSGQIRIYDSADNRLVDTVEVGLPTNQQSYEIGGTPLHAYPVIIQDRTAVIYPHHHSLAYHKTYYVQIDPGALTIGGVPFPGIAGTDGWVFSTKAAPPAAGSDRVVVSADGTGDFATVQGAIDFVPENNAKRLTIFLRKGVYTEIVSFGAKDNITFLGEDRRQTIVTYANNNNFQPNTAAPAGQQFGGTSYRRGVFMGFNSAGVVLANFTVRNSTPNGGSQAEGVLFKEVRNQAGPNRSQTILTHMNLYSHVDTLQITGQGYIADTYIEGDGDYMWGDGPYFFIRSHFHGLKNGSSFTQPRNPATQHGFVYVDSTFDAAEGVDRAFLGNGGGSSEVALIDCVLGNAFPPTGWAGRGAAHNAEYHLTKLSDGQPFDTRQWPASVRHFDKEKDAETIANYRNPTWVLGGWTPALAPLILTPPSATTAASGQPVKLTVVAAGIPAVTCQWQRNGAPVKDGSGVAGATTDTLVIANATAAAAGNYAVTVTNASGAATSAAVALSVSR
jgi:pectin methylesterase-like acyl-CoA thioesterase